MDRLCSNQTRRGYKTEHNINMSTTEVSTSCGVFRRLGEAAYGEFTDTDTLWYLPLETGVVTAIPMDDEDYLADPDFAEVLEVLGDDETWPTHEINDGQCPTIHARACFENQQLHCERTYFVTAIPFDDQSDYDQLNHQEFYHPKNMRHSLDGGELSVCLEIDGSRGAEMADLDVEEIQKLLYLEDIENWEERVSTATSSSFDQSFRFTDAVTSYATTVPAVPSIPFDSRAADISGQPSSSKRQRVSIEEDFAVESWFVEDDRQPPVSKRKTSARESSSSKDAPRTSRQLATAKRERERGKFKRNTILWVPVTDLFDR